MLTPRLAVLLLVLASACAPFPDVDLAAGPAQAPPPRLLPIDGLLAQAGPDTPDPGPALISRAAGLRARAAALATPEPAAAAAP